MIEAVLSDILTRAKAFHGSGIGHISNGQPIILLVAGLLATAIYIFRCAQAWFSPPNGPVIGYRYFMEPSWLLGLRFTRGSREIIQQGYQQYKSTNGIYRVRCHNIEITVLPHKYVDEIRSLPEDKVSSPQALSDKTLGTYSGVDIILESRLHVHALQQHLTPTLAAVVGVVREELDFAASVDLPACQDQWVSVDMHATLARLVSRLSSRIFGGTELSRNEEWLTTSIQYPQVAFVTAFGLRIVPAILRPVFALLLPHYWRTQYHIASAKRIVGDIVRRRRAAEAEQREAYDKPNDLIQWMMDAADEKDATPHKLGHLLLFVSNASVFTTSMLISHCIYDLCANPQYIEPLREEIIAVLSEGGNFHKTMLHKMRKLDSCLKESQRLSPPFLMTLDRVLREQLTLSDGTTLPAGSYIAMATDAIMHDPEFLPPGGADPDSFDPFRYSRVREDPTKPENALRYQLATTEATSMPFGHGKFACPGRFFASSEAKLILCHLLLRYDFRLPEGKTRPQNVLIAENVAPDPNARVLMRKRKTADRDLATLEVAL